MSALDGLQSGVSSVECRVSSVNRADRSALRAFGVTCSTRLQQSRLPSCATRDSRLATRPSLLFELRFEYFSTSPPSHSHSHTTFHALLALNSFHWSQIADRTPLSFLPLPSPPPPPIYFLIVTLYFILGCLNFRSHSIFSLSS